MALTDAQATELQIQRLLIQNEKEKKIDLESGARVVSGLINSGLGYMQLAKETKEAKENAEVSRAMTIANSYMNSKISTDLKSRADYGEESYRDEISSFDIYNIQTIRELNLSDGAKNKLNSAWAQQMPNILGSYEATLPNYQMVGLKNEVDKTASLYYNNDTSTDIQQDLVGYTDFYNSINPKNLPIQGEHNVLLKDDHYNMIVYSGLANLLNNKKTELDYDADTSLGDVISEEKEKLVKKTQEKGANIRTLASEYSILQNLEKDAKLQEQVKSLAKQREDYKIKTIQGNLNETLSTFTDNSKTWLNNYSLQNNKNYTFDFATDENGKYINDSSNILNDFTKQINNIDNLNLSLDQKQAIKTQWLQNLSQTINDNLVNSVLNAESYDKAFEILGKSDNSSQLARDLFNGTDTQDRLNNLLSFARENKIDISTEEGQSKLKYFYTEYSQYRDTDIRKLYNIRKLYDILDEDQLKTELRNKNFDGQTTEQILKEYQSTKSKYAPQIKSHYNSLIQTITDKLYNNETYRNTIGLQKKTDKLPMSCQQLVEDTYYTYLIEHGDEINYTDPKQLAILDNQIYSDLTEYLDGDATSFFSGYYKDLEDLEINDQKSLDFIYKSQQNLLFSSGFNRVFDFLQSDYSAIKLEDFEKNKDLYLNQIAKSYFGAKDYNDLSRMEQIQVQGGFAYFGILKTQESTINKNLENMYNSKIESSNSLLGDYQIDKVVFNNGIPNYLLKDKKSKSSLNNVAVLLTPQNILKQEEHSSKEEESLKNSLPATEWGYISNLSTSTEFYDNYLITCCLKDNNGNINWNSSSSKDFTQNVNPIISVPRNKNTNEEMPEKLRNQQQNLENLIKSYCQQNGVL
jgi:hypothetical protein